MQLNKSAKLLLLAIVSLLALTLSGFSQWNPGYSIGTNTGKYAFSYQQTPDQLVEIAPPVFTPGASLSYQWEQSSTVMRGFSAIAGATGSSYSFSGPLAQTTYFRRKVTDGTGASVYSNTIKIQVVSVNWENRNYVREHTILTPGITGINSWKTIDQLPTGQQLQSTRYEDGMGRPAQSIAKEAATPADGSTTWGDITQIASYDSIGRTVFGYLPYATTTEAGKFKTSPLTEQAMYYGTMYNEAAAYTTTIYDQSPLNRVVNVKESGLSWNSSRGTAAGYELNDATDSVQIFIIGYNTGDAPTQQGNYQAGTLYKTIHTDENGKQAIEYFNKAGQLILSKVQSDDNPTTGHAGWSCTYNVYDDFGRLRYRIQPEGVNYLNANSWSFSGTNGQLVLNEQCFRYEYDDKGRCILKKAPGAAPLQMLYDSRDRVVFMQDGNQALSPSPQWTANLYDELDRVRITTLYNTSKTRIALQTDIDNAVTTTTVNIADPNSPLANLVVTNRDISVKTYTAQNSITFLPGFESGANDSFEAKIDPTIQVPILLTGTMTTFKDPIADVDLNNPGICTIVKYLYYDNYAFTGSKSFSYGFTNNDAYSTSDPAVIPIAASRRTIGYPSGARVRVLGTNTFLNSTEYYDEKGRHIQSLVDNIKSGQDITTFQYHFDGRLLSSSTNHTTTGTGYNNFGILTKNVYDQIGRIASVQKRFGTAAFKTIASYDYDDMGHLKAKHLDPGYTGSGKNELESLSYSYNLHSNITGVNKDYALKSGGSYSKWSNFFGYYLGYDNRDGAFNAAQLDGHVTGQLWSTQGDDALRKYDYSYDNTGRITAALYKEKQKPADNWDNAKMDFSVNGRNGKITFDLNGNLLTMLQKGVVPGNASPITIDDLSYTYGAFSNKLQNVTDQMGNIDLNGQFGDFKDGTNDASPDYLYDGNGNLITDANKGVFGLGNAGGNRGISYNFLDKPELVKIQGKGTLQLVYDADGNKLQKIYTPQGAGAIPVITTYINQFVYKGDSLQYINFEEGRLRVMQPVAQNNGFDALAIGGNISLPNNMQGVYDYFIRDYQENVRMILSEETHGGSNQCTMETERAANEEPVFGQTGGGNEVVQTRFAVSGIPGQTTGNGWQNNSIAKQVSRLGNQLGHKTGPNVLLKVMAGDTINATTLYYYQNAVVNNSGSTSLPNDVLNSLISMIGSSPVTGSIIHSGAGAISNQLANTAPFINLAEPDAANASGNNPKAYLTVMFFDERFNFIQEGSSFIRVSSAGNSNANLTLVGLQAPKNGYAYVYVSNESNEPVYFDNLQVGHNRGRIAEENHYYAYGLRIAGISSKKIANPYEGGIDNKNLYNDKELFDDGDLDWYDYGFRNYDAQIGRFPQLDPLTDNYPYLTPFQYASNDPVGNVDVDGLEGASAVGFGSVANDLGNLVVKSAPKAAAQSVLKNLLTSVGTSFVTAGARIGTSVSERWETFKWNAANRWDNFKESVSNKSESIAAAIRNRAADEGKSVLRTTVDISLNSVGIDLSQPFSFIGGPEAAATHAAFSAARIDLQEIEALIKARQAANTTATTAKRFRAFTSGNFRTNLERLTGSAPANSQAHHVFPQKFARRFKDLGIDIHDPKFGAWWESSSHLKNAKNYNQEWNTFFEGSPTKEGAYDFGKKLMKKYNVPINF